MKRLLTTMGVALALTFSVGAQADPSPEVRERVNMLLRAPEYTGSEADWKAIGPDAAEVLRDVVVDDHQLVSRRGRAAIALGFFPSDATKATLTSVIQSDAHWVVRGRVARTLAVLSPTEAVALMKPLLRHDQARMREAAIKAYGLIPTAASRAALEGRLPDEKKESLQTLIRSTVARIAKREGK